MKEITAIAFPVTVKTDGTVPVMSSVDIAMITGKEHFNVLRDIKVTLEAAEIDHEKYTGCYEGGNGKALPCYFLPEFERDLVVSGYNAGYLSAIIARKNSLESNTVGDLRPRSRRDEILRELRDIRNQSQSPTTDWRDEFRKRCEGIKFKRHPGDTIYLMEAVGSGMVKIGICRGCPSVRRRALQTASAHPLKIIARFPGTISEERAFHRRFKDFHSHGEWFRLEGDLKKFAEDRSGEQKEGGDS